MIKVSSINWIWKQRKSKKTKTHQIKSAFGFETREIPKRKKETIGFDRNEVRGLVEHPSKECETTTDTQNVLLYSMCKCVALEWYWWAFKTTSHSIEFCIHIFLHSYAVVLYKVHTFQYAFCSVLLHVHIYIHSAYVWFVYVYRSRMEWRYVHVFL